LEAVVEMVRLLVRILDLAAAEVVFHQEQMVVNMQEILVVLAAVLELALLGNLVVWDSYLKETQVGEQTPAEMQVEVEEQAALEPLEPLEETAEMEHQTQSLAHL
jgi:hypothetical protein